MNTLLAQADNAVRRVIYDWTRLETFTEWWHKPLLALICAVVIALVLYMYRRDSVELKPGVGVLLLILRLAAYGGLLLFYLGLEKKTEQQITRNSRALVLIDTSASMARRDAGPKAGAISRIEDVIGTLSAGDASLIKELQAKHDVSVYRFDEEFKHVATFRKPVDPNLNKPQTIADPEALEADVAPYRLAALVAAGAFVVLLVFWIGLRISNGYFTAPWLWGGLVGLSLLACLGCLARLNMTYPDLNLLAILKLSDEPLISPETKSEAEHAPVEEKPVDWAAELAPKGAETRIGEALQKLVEEERNTPVAAVVLFTDGSQNAGIDPKQAIELAKETKIPVYSVGLGSTDKPANLRVARLDVPPRVFPGDGFKVTGYVQGENLKSPLATVELRWRKTGKDANEPWQSEGTQQVSIGTDGKEVPVPFDLSGTTDVGRRTYQFRVTPPKDDSNPNDDAQEQEIEVVERKNKVLLIAGGPTREYQFLRTQLKRDKDTIVHVFLQSAADGVSQEAHQLLTEFPANDTDLESYDCIVAFDPNWAALKSSQIEALERWVAEQAGGLIVLAGPVYTDLVAKNESLAKIRALYPVEFPRRLRVEGGRFGSKRPSQIQFTRAGQDAEYLWLDDTAAKNREAWDRFPGVYGYYEANSAKPAASVLGHYIDPDSTQQQIYLAEQFYGAGRVFYMGSGEMWRLRSVELGYFEQYWTKLIRHVSQGRLLRGSSRGVLLVERDRYPVSATVAVRAVLKNAQLGPLVNDNVVLDVQPPTGPITHIKLTMDKDRKGTYHGQVPLPLEGGYLFSLQVPESSNDVLTKRIQAVVSDRELEHPELNQTLLTEISTATGGKYFRGTAAVHGDEPLAPRLQDRTERIFMPPQPDKSWQRAWLTWILVGVCGVLCAEWIVRRVCKLA